MLEISTRTEQIMSLRSSVLTAKRSYFDEEICHCSFTVGNVFQGRHMLLDRFLKKKKVSSKCRRVHLYLSNASSTFTVRLLLTSRLRGLIGVFIS